ncbi:MAG TPA: GTP-binding protein [Gammaproteobacteria bacterium]|nr:GTP-binding protein [Gammaproteobacteria bacterium]
MAKTSGKKRGSWLAWPWKRAAPAATEALVPAEAGDEHLLRARDSLRRLLEDPRLPEGVRDALAPEFDGVQRMLDKLEQGEIHIAVLGEVSVGKSSLLNALLGEARFSTSPLHGETRRPADARWQEERSGAVRLLDTPGINEIGGEERERMAREVAERADLVLFVVDGDLNASERQALDQALQPGRPVLLVLNKADRYTEAERQTLLARLSERMAGRLPPEQVIAAAADPAPVTRVLRAPDGTEREERQVLPPDVEELRERLWSILEREGRTLAAVTAGLFAGRVSERVGQRVVELRREAAERLVRQYCIAKGVAVAVNPLPVTDLLAAAALDAGMVFHLSRLYGLPLSRAEAGSLVTVIATQMSLLMGTVWLTHLLSAALKVGTGGLSTVFTAGAQGAVAYYGTYMIGRVAERYFAQGKSWGAGGPKAVVQEILESVDRDSVLAQARRDLARGNGANPH